MIGDDKEEVEWSWNAGVMKWCEGGDVVGSVWRKRGGDSEGVGFEAVGEGGKEWGVEMGLSVEEVVKMEI
ncbi:hypothetical protein, partial [Siminovitchia fortis]|uniref:hypothetical protein n=1 Tax=Siminovitchia fortis TaxID=254758 RepID=UPI0011A1CF2C